RCCGACGGVAYHEGGYSPYIAANVISLIACMAGTGFAAQLLLSRSPKKEVPKEASHDFSS
ncbi:hypothetical protein, partial [Dialister invisus]|uniref:hypothetical protein n=1 Tax=Dialister invisus TaxID=218538 RepID=UPI0039A2FB56